ncbi:MAG: helix-turn-helix transcriptional regulator [Natronohydrobacter sp.]|nr:helix-turn-helix transcriptional regulator [Natronohydrobacter sp.]
MKASKAGGKRYSVETLEKLAEVLGLELYFGPPRGADPEPPVLDIDGDDFAAIPRLAVEASAGTGALNDDTPEIVGKLAFRRDWLRKIGVKPDRAMLITVTGDSMAPDLRPGDLALIDQDRNAWEHNRVVALVDLDGGLRIKRVLLDPGRAMVLASDNPAHLPELRTKHEAARLTCLGRVVWSGRHWE